MHRTRTTRALLLAVGLAGTVVLGACSSSDPTPGTTGTTAGTTPGSVARGEGAAPGTDVPGTTGSVPGTSTSTTTAPASTTTSTAGTETTLAGGPTTSVVVSPAAQAFCARVAEADKEFSDLGTESDDMIPRMQQTFAELAALAPDDIKADVATFARILSTVTTFDQLAQLESPELTQASDRLTAWTEANCER